MAWDSHHGLRFMPTTYPQSMQRHIAKPQCCCLLVWEPLTHRPHDGMDGMQAAAISCSEKDQVGNRSSFVWPHHHWCWASQLPGGLGWQVRGLRHTAALREHMLWKGDGFWKSLSSGCIEKMSLTRARGRARWFPTRDNFSLRPCKMRLHSTGQEGNKKRQLSGQGNDVRKDRGT